MARNTHLIHIHRIALAVQVLRTEFPASNSGESKFFAMKYPHIDKWTVYCTDYDLYRSKRFLKFWRELTGVIEVPAMLSFYSASHLKIELDRFVGRPTPVIGRVWEPEQNFIKSLVKAGSI